MNDRKKALLFEKVTHITGTQPYSIHHTMISPGEASVLYLHWHNEMEFFYLGAGTVSFYIEEERYLLNAGEGIFIPPGLLHRAEDEKKAGCEFHALVFSVSFLSDYFMNLNYAEYLYPVMHYGLRCSLHLKPTVEWHHEILSLLKESFELPLGAQKTWELRLHGMLLIMWQCLYNHHLSAIDSIKNLTRLTEQLKPSLDFIQSYFNEDITLKRLSSESHLSEGQFCRLFKQLTGFSPFAYLNRCRIIKSCEYLVRTDKKIAEIAFLCGYNNISFYNREFLRYMKVKPSVYRKNVERNESGIEPPVNVGISK